MRRLPIVSSRLPGRARLHWVLPALLLATFLLGLNSQQAAAQLPQIRLATIHPVGGERGKPIDLTFTGTDIDEASGLLFSHPGITAVQKTQMVDGKAQPVANTFTVTIAGDVPNGLYDCRVRGLFGLSNPRTFAVVDNVAVIETEPNNQDSKAQVVALNSTISGRSDGGADVDWYKVTGKGGQRVLVEVAAGRLDSRMEPVVELYANGRRLARRTQVGRADVVLDYTPPADGDFLIRVSDRIFGGSPEHTYLMKVHTGPLVEFTLPASGLPGTNTEFTLFGRNLPGGQPSTQKSSDGKPLEMLKVAIPLGGDPSTLDSAAPVRPEASSIDALTYRYQGANGVSTPISIYYATAATAVEVEPNDTPDKSQKLVAPFELSGQFQNRRDSDIYQFEAKVGDVYWIDVYGQRNGNVSDPVFVLENVKVDDKGVEQITRVTLADDNPLNVGGALFNTATDDPSYRFVVPADGVYRINVRDRFFENRGDPSMVYRLSVRKESPDFRLVAMPTFPSPDPNLQASTWDLSIRKGDSINLVVMAHRKDGYTGDIQVSVEGLPAGVTSTGASIGSTQNQAVVVIRSAENAAEWAGPIRIVGKGRIPNAAQLKAVTDGEAARVAAVQAIPGLIKAVTDSETALKAANDVALKAKEALDKDVNNEGLKKAKADADTAAAKAAATHKAAVDAKAAGDKKIVDTNAAVVAAKQQRDQAPEITRDARGGTIVFSGNPGAQITAESRVARQLTLAVLKETAAYQLTTDAVKFQVNAGSQILIPVNLVKRAGFDNPVTLNFVQPIPNVQVENKPINKGEAAGVYRVYVANNAPLGTYTLFLQGTGQITYSRNPEAAAAAAKDKEATDKLAVEKADLAKKAADAKVVSDKKAVDTAAEAKKAVDAKAIADKLVTDTAAAAKAAADAKVITDKAVTDTETAKKTAVATQTAATEALNKDPNNEGLKKAKADADAAVAKVDADLKKAQDAKVAADKKATETADAAKKAADAKVVSDKLAVDTDAAAKKAAEEKVIADKLAVDTDAASKAAAAQKAAADKKATDTANAAKPTNPNLIAPAAAVVVSIRQAPGTLAANVANGGALKRGATVETKVTINRANGFSGPVTLGLPLPPNVVGLSAPAVTIPADKTEGTLVIQAAGDATLGQLPNMVVRATFDFDGAGSIDQPIAINVQQ